MKIFELLTESQVGKRALDFKRSNRYPDGSDIPESLPPRYQLASNPGVPANQQCSNCGYYDPATKKCDKFKGEPVVKPAYWCLKWEPIEEEVTEGVAGPKQCWPGHRKVGTQPGTGKNKGERVNDCKKIKEQRVAEVNELPGKDKVHGATAMPAPSPALKRILMSHIDELREFVKYGELDPTGDLFFEVAEYFMDEIPIPVRRDPLRLERRIRNMIAPYAKFYTSTNLMNGQGVAEGSLEEGYGRYYCSTDKKWKTRKGPTQTRESVDIDESLIQEFDMIERIIEGIADRHAVDADLVWEDLATLSNDELYVFAVTQEAVFEDWQKTNKRDKTDGMSQKAVNAYRREHPGSKLKTAVTTKPGKLKRGSKASKRRKSYCSRSAGQKRMHNIDCSKTPDKAICKARRRWNC